MATRKNSNGSASVSTPVENSVEKRVFNSNDAIPCKSSTSGELVMIGPKTGILYKWANYGDVTDVEYSDLLYVVRSNSVYITEPRFIILDDDFVEQNPSVQKVYDNMYSNCELLDILNLPEYKMREAISTLSKGARDTLKSLAATAILGGSLDSVKKIKVLDEVFETQMLATLLDR